MKRVMQTNGATRCVIYDCDGVLFDSLEANRHFYNYFCLSLGRPPVTDEELKYVHIHTNLEGFHFLFQNDPSLVEKAFELSSRMDPRESIRYLKLEPNLLSALKMLKENGIIRSINTNRSSSMEYILGHFGLEYYFDLVVTAHDVQNPKPHPESIEKIMKTFSLKRNEIIFVGDSEIDQQAAFSAGVKFIAYKNKQIPADAFMDDHLSLMNFL
jgi:phosphoglycolate phosphatase